MKVVRKLCWFFLILLLSLMLTFNVYQFVCIHILHQELPNFFGYSLLEVVSGSMEPNIHIGDLIVIDRRTNDYQIGDIVTYVDEYASFVTHRIVERTEDSVTTKGDANNSEDPSISPEDIVGKFIFQLPSFGIVLSSFQNPIVLFFIFLIGVLICYLISTDKDGNPIFDTEEQEFIDFLKYRDELVKENYVEVEEEIPVIYLKDIQNAVPMDMEMPKLKSTLKKNKVHPPHKKRKKKKGKKKNK